LLEFGGEAAVDRGERALRSVGIIGLADRQARGSQVVEDLLQRGPVGSLGPVADDASI